MAKKRTKKRPRKKKSKIWTTPNILGLMLTALGTFGLIELRPQLNVTPEAELATNQPLSCPFQVTNAGYLSLHVDNVIVVFPVVKYAEGIDITNWGIGDRQWDNFDLERGGGKTIFAYFANGAPQKAEIVIAVDYRYFGIKRRWLFRFEGIHIDSWIWSREPAGNDEATINANVDSALAKHREALARDHSSGNAD